MTFNTISVDVEDYFHASNLSKVAPPSNWNNLPHRVEYSTHKTLDIFDKHNAKGTFFILGYIAHRYPNLIKEIANRGHEIASHGYAHKLVYHQSPQQFFRDISISKNLLEQISAKQVIGYRAPNFSITDKCPWAYSMLAKAGYKYDSSNYPTWHPRYSNLKNTCEKFNIDTDFGQITVFPLAVAIINLLLFNLRLPSAGGAYWRLLPKVYNLLALRIIEKSQKLPINCYFHPWELDDKQPLFMKLPFVTKLRHYGGINNFDRTLGFYFKSFKFNTFDSALYCNQNS